MLTLLLMVLLPIVLLGVHKAEGLYVRRRAYFAPAARPVFPAAPWDVR